MKPAFATLLGGALFCAGSLVGAHRSSPPPLPGNLQDILQHVSIVYLDNGNGVPLKTLRFDGVNLQIVNGLGATNGNPARPESIARGETQTNGLGNLILGYHEGPIYPFHRTGSHNLVVGRSLNYESFGGIIAGASHVVEEPYSVALGGLGHVVRGAPYGAILGGQVCTANGPFSTVVGSNLSAAGGADGAMVLGGTGNSAHGAWSVSLGGEQNFVSGRAASVVGGSSRFAQGEHDLRAGTLFSDR